MVAVWPDGETSHPYERLPFEVHYPYADGSVVELCLPESMRECGVSQYKRESLKPDNFCAINIAPSHSFCSFATPEGSCNFGEGFSNRTNYVEEPKNLGLPFNVQALIGEGVGSKYNENVAKAMAAINKQTFCGNSPNLPALMGQLCGPVCRNAGFEIVPGTARMVSVQDDGGYRDALFALIFRFQHVPGDISQFPDDGCVVAFRGAFVNDNNRSSDFHSAQTGMSNVHGPGCMADSKCEGHTGFFNTWSKLQDPVFEGLASAGCPEGSNVVVTGYSLGGAVVPFAMYYLQMAGWKVRSSYTISQPRVSNQAFADTFMETMGENATLFRITFGYDAVSRWPSTAHGYTQLGYEVHYIEGTHAYEMCGYAKAGETKCGMDNYPKAELSYDKYHCPNPLAPNGTMCPVDAEFYDQCWGVMGV